MTLSYFPSSTDFALINRPNVLLVELSTGNDSASIALLEAGHDVLVSDRPDQALQAVQEQPFDVLIVDVGSNSTEGLGFLRCLKLVQPVQPFSLILMATTDEREIAIDSLGLGVDDYVRKPISTDELVARVRAKLDRPSMPVELMRRQPTSGLLSPSAFREELTREIRRSAHTGRTGCVAAVDLAERKTLTFRLGDHADRDIRAQLSKSPDFGISDLFHTTMTDDGCLLVLMPDTEAIEANQELLRLSEQMANGSFAAANEPVFATPVTGFTTFCGLSTDREMVVSRAITAANVAAGHLDLQPIEWHRSFDEANKPSTEGHGEKKSTLADRLRTPLQIFATVIIGIIFPFVVYVLFDRAGIDVASAVCLVVVAAIFLTATLIWIEGFMALGPKRPPAPRRGPHPPATAVIAAYLPNEASTVLQTVEAFLKIDYPGPLQVILAYNTPKPLPVESRLKEIAASNSRFHPYKVVGSTSKAQNINAALANVTGEIMGVFDADHHPEPDCFRRAWRWIGGGYDVVQGHCVIRNGGESLVTKTVAVEFESIYAVSHPGRSRFHQFGIFGGSNGYWRTDVLRKVRMHGFMLTEDIDSSLRLTESGGSIASDPALLSRELAPTTLVALWNQRMRWAQGWFQVSRKHFLRSLRSTSLTIQQKLGIVFLLAWRELYPWVSLQILPLFAFFAYRSGGVSGSAFLVPVFLVSSLYTLSVSPGQTYFAYRLAAPEIRKHKLWFISYLFFSTFLYSEMKNTISRVAQIKELSGDQQWTVTPRTSPSNSSISDFDTSDAGSGAKVLEASLQDG